MLILLALGNYLGHQLVRTAAQQSAPPQQRRYYGNSPYCEDIIAAAGITLLSLDLTGRSLQITAQSSPRSAYMNRYCRRFGLIAQICTSG